ncbi:thiamine-monophosphate kinase [Burkholderiales bacterium]|nr:thiamine-monophosphate kinase [Burkholderiales bacterium]
MRPPAGSAVSEARGEFALIARHFDRPSRDPSVHVGVGDDAAVVAPTPGHEVVLAVDMMVEGRHFLAGTDPEALGHRILAVNLSDMAAMGARPRWALLAGALPDDDDAWLAALSRGLFALAHRHGVDLVGGDTTRGPRNLCLTIAGEVPAGRAILRSGAREGDDLWVSGTLGDAMLGLAALEGRTSLDSASRAGCVARLERPSPRVALGVALRGVAGAMLDVSDGLVGDLGHMLDASRVGAIVDLAALPRSAALDAKLAGDERTLALSCLLAGGDDYELVFAAPSAMRARVAAAAREGGVAVARIGRIVAQGGLVVNDERGAPLDALPRAFDHFAPEPR